MPYTIEKATKDDVQEIINLIVELAIYEKLPEEAICTPELMVKNMFENRYAECLLLWHTADGSTGKREAVGMALYFFTFSTWKGTPSLYLEDLFIKQSHRGAGYGKRLFGELGAIAKEKGCSRVEWRVLKWNQPSIDFYVECLKATPQTEWEGMRVEGDEAIERLIKFRR